MSGRAGVLEEKKWSNVIYIPCTEKNHFIPEIPELRMDIL
jgi:LL-diaminopimelate aminotransferase